MDKVKLGKGEKASLIINNQVESESSFFALPFSSTTAAVFLMRNDDGSKQDFYRFSSHKSHMFVCPNVRMCVPENENLFSPLFHLIFTFLAFEREIAQHEHDYLISHKHNLRIFIRKGREESEGEGLNVAESSLSF